MDGRWTLLVNRHGEAWVCDPDVSVLPQTGEALTPVVPCDDDAVERVAAALFPHIPSPYTDDEAERFARSLALMALGAARAPS